MKFFHFSLDFFLRLVYANFKEEDFFLFYTNRWLANANLYVGGMSMAALDRILANHCSATLVGVKSACLVSCCRIPSGQLDAAVAEYNRALNRKGLLFRLYRSAAGLPLLFVYRPSLLWARLRSADTAPLLTGAGYSMEDGLKGCLDRLGARLAAEDEFPHEIGLFLDYPPADVIGYLQNRGRNCKLCGYWKVYSDVDRASRLFRLYDDCRETLCAHLDLGQRLVDLPYSTALPLSA